MKDGQQGKADYFQAPAEFVGNLSQYYNGWLNFQLMDDSVVDITYRPLLLIDANGNRLSHAVATLPSDVFASFSFQLNESAGWLYAPQGGNNRTPTKQQFQSVLTNVVYLQIPGDLATVGGSSGEHVSLDNVALVSAPAPVLAISSNSVRITGATNQIYELQRSAEPNFNTWQLRRVLECA